MGKKDKAGGEGREASERAEQDGKVKRKRYEAKLAQLHMDAARSPGW